VVAAPPLLPIAGTTPTVVASTVAPATAPAPTTAPAMSTATTSAPPPPPPAAAGAGFAPYVVGPPGMGFGSGMNTGASSSARRKAPEPDSVAAAAAAAGRQEARARRRRRATLRDYGDQFMDMDVEVDPDWGAPPASEPVASTVASDRAAGPLGCAGTVGEDALGQAVGLTTLPGDEFGGGPTVPMVPSSWEPDAPGDQQPTAPAR
ncbi:MAG: hypothetical protein ACRDTV_12060, partial [Mycobacterium sp.]